MKNLALLLLLLTGCDYPDDELEIKTADQLNKEIQYHRQLNQSLEINFHLPPKEAI